MGIQRPKILVEAYECSPVREHAPGAVWQTVSRLSRWFELWVLVEETQYRREIEAYTVQHPELAETLHFEFIRRRRVEGFKRKRPPLPIGENLDYQIWQKEAYKRALRLDALYRFDLVHHLRSNSFRTPGFLWRLDRPFVWGPMGGTYCVPGMLTAGLELRRRIEYILKNTITAFQFRWSPTVRRAVNKAAVIFAQTSHDQHNLQRVYRKASTLLHEQAADCQEGKVHQYSEKRPLNIAWIGRCISGKAMELLLYAAARTRRSDKLCLHLVGDGPEMGRWRAIAETLGIAERCIWYGWVDQQRANEILNNSDMLAFTSLLEGTSATVIKAISLGVPVLCLKHCGMGDVVDQRCGFALPVGRPEEVISGFSGVLDLVLEDPAIIEGLSRGALQKAAGYTWDCCAESIRDAYQQCLKRVSFKQGESAIKHSDCKGSLLNSALR